jgi:lantibiotic modifying enzyme
MSTVNTEPMTVPLLTTTALPETTVAHEQLSEAFLLQAAESLLKMHEDNQGGWRFKSEIQSSHYQTDRDVGAASVGMGLLSLAEQYPHDNRWLDAATKTAIWLKAVSVEDGKGGRFWPDYADDDTSSEDVYTSFDDGALGIGDFFWRLYEKTNDPDHKAVALASVEWTLSQAEKVASGFRWKWNVNHIDPSYQMGMGLGIVGIVHTLTTYYERTYQSDPAVAIKCRQYVEGAVDYIKSAQQALGNNSGDMRALPETGVIGKDGDTAMNAGYLSGAAGAAFMYLKLFQLIKDQSYLGEADKLFSWLDDADTGPLVDNGDGTIAWKLMLDKQSDDNPALATGMEEGAAGIGWVYLQAYELTGTTRYLNSAKAAANWLLKVAIKDESGGMSWHEDESSQQDGSTTQTNNIAHPNLNNGAAGIGMFLEDTYQVTKDPRYKAGAVGAMQWLSATAVKNDQNIYWKDNDGGTPFMNDTSWHWGSGGIISFLLRMQGSHQDIPGEQNSLNKVV